ncbi:hypothetical protein NP493_116g05036 [Ridgeia piscesae]|uniref:Uncharacterized protein n=1 Tax=Ridgeia piscesae TaxID=27915 RepID=A0AAD9UM53_RIDPI|nr:hypothetical protein NP493_116g05036 [Ridgeia piscesae]
MVGGVACCQLRFGVGCVYFQHTLLDEICSSLATWPLVALGVGSINGFIEVIPRSHFYHLYLVTVTNEVLNVGVVSSVLFVLPSVSICRTVYYYNKRKCIIQCADYCSSTSSNPFTCVKCVWFMHLIGYK